MNEPNKVLMVVTGLHIDGFVCEFEDDVIKTCSLDPSAALRMTESHANIIADNQNIAVLKKVLVIDQRAMYQIVSDLSINFK